MGLETPLPPEDRPKSAASEAAAVDGRAASSPPESPAPAASDRPPIAAKADDLEAIKKAVDDAASVGGGLWLSYLFVLFYLAVAAGAVTHADLFLENSVKLPFLNIELPLLAFFLLAPILFLIVHAYTLVHLVMLTDKAKRFYRALDDRDVAVTVRENLQWQLPSSIFVQFLVGLEPKNFRQRAFRWLLWFMAWLTLLIAPVLLLLLLQVQFLPFHWGVITWTHRIVLLLDLVLMWWLWSMILTGRGKKGRLAPWAWSLVGFGLAACSLIFSSAIATFPGEWQADLLAEWDQPEWAVAARNALFNSTPDVITHRRFPFSNTLVLPGFNIYEGLGIDDPEKVEWRDFVFRARGRDLRGAIFDLANLPKVDFTGADLRGASLFSAHLEGASLASPLVETGPLWTVARSTHGPPRPRINFDRLRHASFGGAQLEGAILDHVHLEGASLDDAQLPGASLADARLEGATLAGAQLSGASLQGARLDGADLDNAQLVGAWLFGAQLQGASLVNAWLQGANLSFAQLQGALLVGAQLHGAELDNAQLQGTSFVGAQLQGASFKYAVLEATDLSGAFLWRTNRPDSPPAIAAIRMSGESWLPEWINPDDKDPKRRAWGDKIYQALQAMIESVPPLEKLRDAALEHIRSLDCSNYDKTRLASCDPRSPLPPEATAWQVALKRASVDDDDYTAALTSVLRGLVCSGGDDAPQVLRGLSRTVFARYQSRLEDAGPMAIDLIKDLTKKDNKDCPVAASLTDADRAKLQQIKQDIEEAKATQKSVTSDAPYSP
jgi:uncharacterized protein YjbI with pentapeptide repeats